MKTTLLGRAAELIFPPRCPICGELSGQSGRCCPSCEKELYRLPDEQLLELDNCRIYAPFYYRGGMKNALYRFKFRGEQQLAEYFAGEMASILKEHLGEPLPFAAVSYVPMPEVREKERGYNQARLLAEYLARGQRLPVDSCGLVRHSAFAQHDMAGTMRKKQMDAGISIQPERQLCGHILLVDDLCTSGATLRCCARLLREAGAEEVTAVTFCR